MAKVYKSKNFAEYRLKKEMAKKPTTALEFIDKIIHKVTPKAITDNNFLMIEGEKILGRKVQYWDRTYVYEKLLKQRQVDYLKVKEYFQVDEVVSKTFKWVENMFDIKIKQKPCNAWDEQVLYYEIYEKDELVSSFYVDLYKRDNKQAGAWCSPLVTRDFSQDNKIKAKGLLVSNLPYFGKNSKFDWDDLVTFYHELGHLLHFCLSKVNVPTFSGFNEIENDVIEFPSQLIENFVYEYEIIKKISELPEEEFKKLKDNKVFLASSGILSQSINSKMDLVFYMQEDMKKTAIEIEKEIKDQHLHFYDYDKSIFMMPKFQHLFGPGLSY